MQKVTGAGHHDALRTFRQKIEHSGPIFESARFDGGKAIVSFSHRGSGLVAQGDKLTGFLLCGEDRKFVRADATIEGDKVIDFNPDLSQITRRYTEKSVSFIERNKTRPFFLYLAQTMPHIPLAVSERFKDKSGRGMYGDVLLELDW